ncbi:uncharacterized protein M6B38_413495 [Iris pallida]|uniref:Uncharacterized protein n=1 Tax=Iris pallida TaxID=29817 RepID=A0AAX6FKW2_IRIPA|nr:uncharacterized protein M6B38_146985 [Iris pallida]KAJ6816913.1 uncharacterized protein M6B38_413495 [Iris pallida]
MSFRESSTVAVFQYVVSSEAAASGADGAEEGVGLGAGLGLLPRVREERREWNLLLGLLREELSTGTTEFLSRDEGRHLLQRTEKLPLVGVVAAAFSGWRWSGVGWCLYGNVSSAAVADALIIPSSSSTSSSGICPERKTSRRN